MKSYKEDTSKQFIEDMEEAGYPVEHYLGRFYWEGPAVRVLDHHELADAISSTAVRVQYDNMGLGYIVYPLQPDPGYIVAKAGE